MFSITAQLVLECLTYNILQHLLVLAHFNRCKLERLLVLERFKPCKVQRLLVCWSRIVPPAVTCSICWSPSNAVNFVGLATLQLWIATKCNKLVHLVVLASCKSRRLLVLQRSTTTTSSLGKEWAFGIGGTDKA